LGEIPIKRKRLGGPRVIRKVSPAKGGGYLETRFKRGNYEKKRKVKVRKGRVEKVPKGGSSHGEGGELLVRKLERGDGQQRGGKYKTWPKEKKTRCRKGS